MTPTPSWLYYFFALAMLVVAAYGLVLLAVAVTSRRWRPGWDVDVTHIFMGVAMAGMFVTDWSFGPNAIWELIFTLLLVWFLVQSVQSLIAFGIHLTHYLIHAVMNFAMLLMYVVPARSGSGAMSMAMGSPSSARIDPGLSLLLAFTLLASAVFTLASPIKGASHHGSHSPTYAVGGPEGEAAEPSGGRLLTLTDRGAVRVITDPRLEDASHVVMAIGMAFLMILLI